MLTPAEKAVFSSQQRPLPTVTGDELRELWRSGFSDSSGIGDRGSIDDFAAQKYPELPYTILSRDLSLTTSARQAP
jgi:hypothetical protein